MACLLQGGNILPFYSTDGEYLFRQEAYFHYLFGVNEDGFWGALDIRNVSKHWLASQKLRLRYWPAYTLPLGLCWAAMRLPPNSQERIQEPTAARAPVSLVAHTPTPPPPNRHPTLLPHLMLLSYIHTLYPAGSFIPVHSQAGRLICCVVWTCARTRLLQGGTHSQGWQEGGEGKVRESLVIMKL